MNNVKKQNTSIQNQKPQFIKWSAPTKIKAFSTEYTDLQNWLAPAHKQNSISYLRIGHTQVSKIIKNVPISWMNQSHSTEVSIAKEHGFIPFVDACYTKNTNLACAVKTGDCLPILLCNEQGSWIAAAHAGWKGLLNNIIYKTINKSPSKSKSHHAFIGTSICAKCYVVNNEFQEKFLSVNKDYKHYFTSSNKIHANLQKIAQHQLISLGILPENITTSKNCTHCNPEFPSYRRDKTYSGRIASLIYIEK